MNKFWFLLTFLVISISGNPAIAIFGKEVVSIVIFIIFVVLFYLKVVRLTRKDVFIVVYFFLLTLVHVLSFGSSVVVSSLGFLINLGIALLAIRLIPDFTSRYISVMYVLSLISFVFWVPTIVGVDMQNIFSAIHLPISELYIHVGIYNFRIEVDGAIRNAGMFWEPGAFAGYLILALFFMIRGGQSKVVFSKVGLVLIAALLSTQSTTGYLAFVVLAIFYIYNEKLVKGGVVKFLLFSAIFVIFIGGVYVAINEFSFLGEKIMAQIQSASERDDASRINRFGNFLYDLDWINRRPALGWSSNPATRFSIDPEVAELIAAQGNGLTGFTIKYGFIGLLGFIYFFAQTTRQITGSLAASFFGVAIVCMLLNGEQFMNFPLFFSLMFLPKNKSKSRPSLPGLAVRKSILVDSRLDYKI